MTVLSKGVRLTSKDGRKLERLINYWRVKMEKGKNNLKAMEQLEKDIRVIINLYPEINTIDKMCQCLYYGSVTNSWDVIAKSTLSRTDVKLLVSSLMD